MVYLQVNKITLTCHSIYYLTIKWVSEWVSDCCLMPTQQFSAISWQEQVNFQWGDDEVFFVLDQHALLDFYSASSLKQHSAGKYVIPLGHIILITMVY